MPDQPVFVQFPHPGSERDANGQDHVPWSTSDTPHTRKFLRAHGTYLTEDRVVSGPLAFWGEWEPPSRIIHAFALADDRNPRWLHEPLWQGPVPRSAHNTDPLVFGGHFTYSNCRQRRQQKLRHLEPGSLILFGSATKIYGNPEFVLDTVMVVGHSAGEPEGYTPASSSGLACQPIVQGVVFDPLRSDPRWSDLELTLYRGRTYQEAPQGPFSFVPCKPCDDVSACAFARPVIELAEPSPVANSSWLNPSAAMVARCQPASSDQLERIWREVVEQVRAKGLALGVHIEAPEEIGVKATAESTQVRLRRPGSC
jgi:hypothetical protein